MQAIAAPTSARRALWKAGLAEHDDLERIGGIVVQRPEPPGRRRKRLGAPEGYTGSPALRNIEE